MTILKIMVSGLCALMLVVFGLVACSVSMPEGRQPEGKQPEGTPPQGEPQERTQADGSGPLAGKGLEEVIVTATKRRAGLLDSSQSAVPQSALSFISHHPAHPPVSRDQYEVFNDNRWTWTRQQSVSTFSSDVDTAAYAMMRRSLEDGLLPLADAIRVEELVNYFNYQYPSPQGPHPFAIYQELGPSPWAGNTRLLHVGINTQPPAGIADLPPANLTFLVDVSGSMQAANKLGLLKRALKLLTRQLRSQDRISLVVYAGAAGTVLESTPGSEKAKILNAIDQLQAGGSTNGSHGIHLAYQIAQQHKIAGGINRVMLATDGDFNVGTTNTRQLEKLVEQKRQSGVALTVLGFGTGNLNDHMMQKIAQIGDGNAAYIDSMHEARKVLVDELGATLNIVARDVKFQIEFNPATVQAYRLIGYETRHLNREDFNNDQVDAGDVGEGHAVTALYELSMVGDAHPLVDPLRYAAPQDTATQDTATVGPQRTQEVAFIKVRYKAVSTGQTKPQGSLLLTRAVAMTDLAKHMQETSQRYQFSSAVAWFGQTLRGNPAVAPMPQTESGDGHVLPPGKQWQQILDLAQQAKGADEQGLRSEFVKLVRTAAVLSTEAVTAAQLPTSPPAG